HFCHAGAELHAARAVLRLSDPSEPQDEFHRSVVARHEPGRQLGRSRQLPRTPWQRRLWPHALQYPGLADPDLGRHPLGTWPCCRRSAQFHRTQAPAHANHCALWLAHSVGDPPIVAVVIWRWLLDPQGAANKALVGLGIIDQPIAFFADVRTVWPAIVTIMVWNTVPLIGLSLLSSLQAVPEELYEAAELEGANQWQVFRYITLPFLMPATLVLGLMSVF